MTRISRRRNTNRYLSVCDDECDGVMLTWVREEWGEKTFWYVQGTGRKRQFDVHWGVRGKRRFDVHLGKGRKDVLICTGE